MALTGPRGATAEEVGDVAALADEVFDCAPGWLRGQCPTLFREDNATWLRTFWEEGRPVSLVAVWRGEIRTFGRRLPVGRVGLVSTRPEYRGRGLAGALLRDALARLQADGSALVVISGRGPLYQRAGARVFGDLREVLVDAAALPPDPAPDLDCAALQTPDAAVVTDMARLYDGEPVRYVRSADDWRLLLPAKHYLSPGRGRGTVLARRGTDAVAYALWQEGDPLDVTEFAGDRAALPAAVAWMLRHTGCARARLRLQPADTAALGWAEAIGAPVAARPHSHSARVLDAHALLDCLASAPGPGPDPGALRALLPRSPLGAPDEPEQAAALTQAALGPGAHALPLPRTDGPNYI